MANTQVRTLGHKAAAILRNGKWTQEALARNSLGNTVSPHSPDADSYCALGSIGVAVRKEGKLEAEIVPLMRTLQTFARSQGDIMFTGWQDSDGRTKDEVIAALEAADKDQ